MAVTNNFLCKKKGQTHTVPAITIKLEDGKASYHNEKLELKGGMIQDKIPAEGTPDLYVTSGFINCHMHWLMNGDTTPFHDMLEEIAADPVKKAEAGISRAMATLKMGITFGWDKGPPGVCALPAYAHMHKALKKGTVMTRFIHAPWAIMSDGCFGFPFGRVARSKEEIDIILLEAQSAGAKAIKFIPESPWLSDHSRFDMAMPESLFTDSRKKAAEKRLLFAVHAKGNALIDQCIATDVDCIEHAIQATEQQMQAFQTKNIYIGPTLHGLECRRQIARQWKQGEKTADYEWQAVKTMVKKASKLNEGAPFTHMLFSSDAGSFATPHASLRELYLMRYNGFNPAAVFQAATVNGARCTRQDRMGSIEKGMIANLIYWQTNPLELPLSAWENLENFIAGVILEGELVTSQ